MYRFYKYLDHTYIRLQPAKPTNKILAVNNSDEVRGIVYYKENLKIDKDYRAITPQLFEKNFEEAKFFLSWEGNRKMKPIKKEQDETTSTNKAM